MELWYRQPAEEWVEALPVGNGRIGGMVFGGVLTERIALNEDTLWSGYPQDTNLPGAWEHILRARKLMEEGRVEEAQACIERHALSSDTTAYQPLGDLVLRFPDLEKKAITEYERVLSLGSAVATTSFTAGEARHERVCFISAPDQALIVHLRASRAGVCGVEIGLDSRLRHKVIQKGEQLLMLVRSPSYSAARYRECEKPIVYGDAPEKKGMDALVMVRVFAEGGKVTFAEDHLRVQNADKVTIALCCRTNFEGFDKTPQAEDARFRMACQRDMKALAEIPYADILSRHLADYRPLFHRVEMELAGEKWDSLPTDERLHRFAAGEEDNGLFALLFQYGRYLLIASSRPGTQAANLQGIWNEEVRPPWSSNYTVNINTEMNYWPAEICNLTEMHLPLFDMVERLQTTGGKTARVMFQARGAVCGHNTDLWGQATPVGEGRKDSSLYGWWPMGYAWLSTHLFERYLFTGDRAFLEARALPACRAAVQFFVDVCGDTPEGFASLYPATSPENSYLQGGAAVHFAMASTMNTAIVSETLQNYCYMLETLGLTEEDGPFAQALLQKLPPPQIGKDGRMLEWDGEKEEAEAEHRHLSHLYGLHPGHQITPEKTPALAEACRASLKGRGDEGTGWSLGWKVNLWARLGDGNRALEIARRQLRLVPHDATNADGGGTYLNLLDAHPPFQIDGNFGITSGIAQMFVQVRLNEILLLPALPDAWPEGRICGLCGANGYLVDINFEGGRLKSARLTCRYRDRAAVRVRYGEKSIVLSLGQGESITLDGELRQ